MMGRRQEERNTEREEEWKSGRLEERKTEREEDWKTGRQEESNSSSRQLL